MPEINEITNSDIKLCFGKVREFTDRGFGFITPLSFVSSADNKHTDVFFHIRTVRHIGIEKELKEFYLSFSNIKPNIYFWYIPENTTKGIQVKECWIDCSNIPKEYIAGFLNDATVFLINTLSEKQAPSILINKEVEIKPPVKPMQAKATDDVAMHYILDDYDDDDNYYYDIDDQSYNYTAYESSDKYGTDSSEGKNNYKSQRKQLTSEQRTEIDKWIEIYKRHQFETQVQVNQYITVNKLWDYFPKIRSLNDHGIHKNVPGVLPEVYAAISKELELSGTRGAPLDKATPY